jgi:hypothetical protein
MSKLPWNEKVVSFQIAPESATIADIVRMAEELVKLWQEMAIRKRWPNGIPSALEETK